MMEFEVAKEIDHSADRVWGVMRKFGEIDWVEGFLRVEVLGEGVGMIRRIFVTEDFHIDERLTAYDEDAKQLAYDFPESFPFQLSNYRAQVKVSSLAENRSKITWTASGELDEGVTEQQARETVRGLYEGLFGNLVAHLAESH